MTVQTRSQNSLRVLLAGDDAGVPADQLFLGVSRGPFERRIDIDHPSIAIGDLDGVDGIVHDIGETEEIQFALFRTRRYLCRRPRTTSARRCLRAAYKHEGIHRPAAVLAETDFRLAGIDWCRQGHRTAGRGESEVSSDEGMEPSSCGRKTGDCPCPLVAVDDLLVRRDDKTHIGDDFQKIAESLSRRRRKSLHH